MASLKFTASPRIGLPSMPDTGQHRPDPSDGTSAAVPTTAEALARLDMPLLEAMMTQRAVRRVLPDPVDDALVLKCIELALRAPTRKRRAELGVHRRQRPPPQGEARQALPPGVEDPIRRGTAARGCPRRVDGQDRARHSVAGRPLHRDPGPGGGLPAPRCPRRTDAVRADAACGRIGILGIDLSQCAEPVTWPRVPWAWVPP